MIKRERVSLVPYDREFFKSTLSMVNDAQTMAFINRVLPVTEMEHEEWSKKVLFDKKWILFAITAGKEPRHIGNCGLKDIDERSRKAELWIYLTPQDTDKGYGIEAISALVEYGFNSLNLNRISAYCLDRNVRAQNAFKKCGFIQEGVFREDVYIGGKYRDTMRLAILKKDFMKGNGSDVAERN
ncbi:MAG: GNAT family N-acetyltransferase [Bacillota bacterium]